MKETTLIKIRDILERRGGRVKDLTFRDLLFVLAFPYILMGYLLLSLIHTPIELLSRCVRCL